MSRIFVISYRKCLGPVGGGTGVNFKLYLANRQYGLLEDCYHIFMDKVITPEMDQVSYSRLGSNAKAPKTGLRAILSRMGMAWISKHKAYRKRIRSYFQELDQTHRFTAEDVYLFQDVESAYEFMKLFPYCKRTVLIYHQQGSLYNEWRSFNSFDLPAYRKYLNRYSEEAYRKVQVLAFPSMGAKESLLQSEPYFEKVLQRPIQVLYNGFTKPSLPDDSDAIKALRQKLEGFDGYKFATVSALNEAKGVERIPEFLAQVGKFHPFRWIIVGSGVKAAELEKNIEKYGIGDSVIWIREPMPHDDILKIFSRTDHYILFHRFSIFDYSTIEAMSYGNIPVLTPIGGNREVIIEDNGVFVEDFGSAEGFRQFMAKAPLEELKNQNRQLQERCFSDEAFLRRYQTLVQTMQREVH
ncbi:MAG: glycosyltransferase [Ruminococcaceae bacterium]|nr:glycosyltransferase [Oscillospiraceae bacterium]